jgi:hypothetical protein
MSDIQILLIIQGVITDGALIILVIILIRELMR